MKKLLLTLLLTLGLVAPALANPGVVQCTAASTATGTTVTPSITVTAGHALIAFVSTFQTNPGISDSKGDSFSTPQFGPWNPSGAYRYSVWVANSVAGGSTAFTGSGGTATHVIACELTGTVNLAVDKSADTSGTTSSSTPTGTTATTTNANEVLFGVFRAASSSTYPTVGTGYTLGAESTETTFGGTFFGEYQVVAATGAYQATANYGGANAYDGFIVTVLDGASGGGGGGTSTCGTLATLGVGCNPQ